MSIATRFDPVPESVPSVPATVRDRLQSATVRPLRVAGFWTAVVAPIAYPLLFLSGLDGQTVTLLLGVVALNALGLLVGRGYGDRD